MLSELEQYMFSNENLIKYKRYFDVNHRERLNNVREDKYKQNKYKENERYEIKKTYITPYEEDKLFWCFYIALNGYNTYLLEKSTHFKIEKDFKINSISTIREKKPQLKSLKLKISDIEDELVNKKRISMKTLNALSLCYNLSFIVVHNDVYYDFNYNNDELYFIIEYVEHKGYSIYLNTLDLKDKIKQIKDDNYLVDSSKMIKSMSSYTLGELQTIALKLKISIKQNTGKNKPKKELYENIIQKLGKLM